MYISTYTHFVYIYIKTCLINALSIYFTLCRVLCAIYYIPTAPLQILCNVIWFCIGFGEEAFLILKYLLLHGYRLHIYGYDFSENAINQAKVIRDSPVVNVTDHCTLTHKDCTLLQNDELKNLKGDILYTQGAVSPLFSMITLRFAIKFTKCMICSYDHIENINKASKYLLCHGKDLKTKSAVIKKKFSATLIGDEDDFKRDMFSVKSSELKGNLTLLDKKIRREVLRMDRSSFQGFKEKLKHHYSKVMDRGFREEVLSLEYWLHTDYPSAKHRHFQEVNEAFMKTIVTEVEEIYATKKSKVRDMQNEVANRIILKASIFYIKLKQEVFQVYERTNETDEEGEYVEDTDSDAEEEYDATPRSQANLSDEVEDVPATPAATPSSQASAAAPNNSAAAATTATVATTITLHASASVNSDRVTRSHARMPLSERKISPHDDDAADDADDEDEDDAAPRKSRCNPYRKRPVMDESDDDISIETSTAAAGRDTCRTNDAAAADRDGDKDGNTGSGRGRNAGNSNPIRKAEEKAAEEATSTTTPGATASANRTFHGDRCRGKTTTVTAATGNTAPYTRWARVEAYEKENSSSDAAAGINAVADAAGIDANATTDDGGVVRADADAATTKSRKRGRNAGNSGASNKQPRYPLNLPGLPNPRSISCFFNTFITCVASCCLSDVEELEVDEEEEWMSLLLQFFVIMQKNGDITEVLYNNLLSKVLERLSMDGNRQQDASELLQLIAYFPPSIRENFSMESIASVKFEDCGCLSHSSITDTYLLLCLPTTSTNVQSLLTEYCHDNPSLLNEEMKCTTENCRQPGGKAQKVTKNIAIIKMPHILILSLKRTDYRGRATKNKAECTFEETVQMTVKDGTVVFYDLFAVCQHHGASANKGHYTTLARLQKEGGVFHEWYAYNDLKAPEQRRQGPFSRNSTDKFNAYMLFYKQIVKK